LRHRRLDHVFFLVLPLAVLVACNHGGGVIDPPAATGPAVVTLEPVESEYHVSGTVTVAVIIANAHNVGSVPFHLRFDHDVLRFLPPAEEGPFMSEGGAATVFLAVEIGGEIVVGISLVGETHGVDGSGLLLKLHFEAVGTGASGFAFTGANVKDPFGVNLPAVFNAQPLTVLP
jgi:hypothetical protein